MESIIQQQQQQQQQQQKQSSKQYLFNSETITTDNYTKFNNIYNNDITNNDINITTNIATTTTTTTTTNTNHAPNNTITTKTNRIESFHSQNSILNTKKTNTNINVNLLQQQQQQNNQQLQQQQKNSDHDKNVVDDDNDNNVDEVKYYKYKHDKYTKNSNNECNNTDDDDDVDDLEYSNQLKPENILTDGNNINKIDKINVLNDDETNEIMKKSSSSTNLRLTFRKSHTCGSLFANCNCDNNALNLFSTLPLKTTPTTTTTTVFHQKEPTAVVQNYYEKRKSQPNYCGENIQLPKSTSISKTSLQNQLINICINPINNYNQSSYCTRTCSDSNLLNNSKCCDINLKTTLKNETTATANKNVATAEQQFDQTNDNATATDSLQTLNFEESNNLISKLKNDDHLKLNSDLKTAKTDSCLFKKTVTQQNKNSTVNNCKKKTRKIFESYSHPDTNFIFTDENCNPNSSQHTSKENLNDKPQHIITKNGNICIKYPKRSSSPNIGSFTILDIHPEILLKIHKSDPNLKGIVDKKLSLESKSSITTESSSSSDSTTTSFSSVIPQKSYHNLKESTLEQQQQQIVNENFIKDCLEQKNCEQKPEVIKSHIEDNNEILTKRLISLNLKRLDLNFLPKRSLPNLSKDTKINCLKKYSENNNCSSSIVNSRLNNSDGIESLLNSKQYFSSGSNDFEKHNNFDTPQSSAKLESAHKYFQESGILGPNIKAEKVNKLIRKTSKIIQDSNFIEHVRKNSKILLCNTPTTLLKEPIKSLKSPSVNENQIDKNMATNTENIKENFNNVLLDEITLQQYQTNNNVNCNNNSNNNNNNGNNDNINLSYNNDKEEIIKHCNCDSRIQTLMDEISTLRDIVTRRDNEIYKLKREIHKLKSVLQQTNASRILLNEKNILQNKHQIEYGQHNTATQLPSPLLPSSTTSSASSASSSSTSSTIHQQQQPQQQHQKLFLNEDLGINYKLINGEYNYAGLVGVPTNPIDKKLIKAKSHDQDMLSSSKDINTNLENGSCAKCISNRSSYQPLIPPLVVKKQGVSGESSDASINRSQNIPIPKYEKDFSSKQLIKDAIMDNDFLKNIDSTQVRELVESMYNLDVAKGEFVIREGDVGSHLYVSAEGNFEVIKNDVILGTMGPGKTFGELAILYNCTRTASIRTLSDGARLWVLDRRIFQQIMMRTGMQRIEENIRFLKSVPLLKNLSMDVLAKIGDVLEVEFYPAGTYIIRQGASGDTFFLISQGTVKVTQKIGNLQEEKEIRTLQRGDYFGEQALINVDKRTANIIAMTPGVECLTLDRESFNHLIGDLCELKEKNYGDENRILAMKYFDQKELKVFGTNVKQEFPELKLTDLEVVATLGIGGFGRVELVKCYHENHVRTYALKCLKKKHIIDTRQEEHVFSERTIMLTCKSPFICRLYKTFRDDKYLYMLLEACMGGEVWTMLRDRGSFNEIQTQFITGCVLQAFEYLHSRNIIYRDLKPENLMLNEKGYIKLVDFGFSKYIGNSQKTWTFCGTPEYVAPEIILNKGHDRAVDYWALGILIHELLNGTPPFTANDPMKTYNIILKGIDMIDFPKHMSKSAILLIKKLCRDVPAERLGYSKAGIEDIKKHKWFQGFDWDSLANLTLIPPFLRPVTNPLDICYFDKFPADTEIPPDETSGWDSDF